MATSVKNLSRVPQSVGVLVDGKPAYIRLMPRSKKFVDLADGTTVDPRWLAHNPDILKIKNTDPAAAQAAVQAAVVEVPAAPTAAPSPTPVVQTPATAPAPAPVVTPAPAPAADPKATTNTAPTVSANQGGK
jgi:hypothetical protein